MNTGCDHFLPLSLKFILTNHPTIFSYLCLKYSTEKRLYKNKDIPFYQHLFSYSTTTGCQMFAEHLKPCLIGFPEIQYKGLPHLSTTVNTITHLTSVSMVTIGPYTLHNKQSQAQTRVLVLFCTHKHNCVTITHPVQQPYLSASTSH